MSETSLDELESRLLGSRLVDLQALQECRDELPLSATPTDLLAALERKHHLTTFQVDRIRKGDIESLVLGDYKLMYRNASGSFARVYRACSLVDGKMVGVKVLRERWSFDRETVDLFRREGEIGQRLKHPNIVPIYGYSRQGNIHSIAMEFVEGGNLREFLKTRGKLHPVEACRYTLHVCEALAYALSLGITHRDMKMTNVLMSSQGTAKLIDFGLAVDERLLHRIGAAGFAQALEYSTLEKHTGAPMNDLRSDLFFLGGILYELVSGQPPYPRTRSRDERRDITRYRNIPPIAEVSPDLPPGMIGMVNRLLELDPDKRYQSPTQIIGELRPMIGHRNGDPAHLSPAESKTEFPTVLCVERRLQQQDWLREYLSRHDYRVLLLSDVERALARMKSSPPDCVILMGGSIGDSVVDDVRRAALLAEAASIVLVVVLSERQGQVIQELQGSNGLLRILKQPIRLRDLREALSDGLHARGKSHG
ncbi:MAG: protein kinase [Planctomycetaceae bacterium]